MAFGWIGSTTAFGAVVRKAIDQVRAGDRLRLPATIPFEFGPDACECGQRSVVVERKPNHESERGNLLSLAFRSRWGGGTEAVDVFDCS